MDYSRLEHHERTVLIRQIMLCFGGGIGLGLLFLFVLLPLFTRVLAIRNVGKQLDTTEEIIPPQAPTLSQPFSATNSASVALEGSAPSGLKVILLQNGSQQDTQTIGDTGTFTFNVTLQAGDNLFQALTEDDKGTRSNPSPDVSIALVTAAPKLEVTSPTNGQTFTQFKQSVIPVNGNTDAGNKIYINDQFVFVSGTGSFSGSVSLQKGDNHITIRAVDPASNETKVELTVQYSP